MSDKTLTAADIAALQEYLQAMDDIAKQEPDKLPSEVWDKVWPTIQTTGQVPTEYADRIGVDENSDPKGYYDIVWEEWNAKVYEINQKYRSIILKALKFALSTGDDKESTNSIFEILQSLISDKDDIDPEQVREAIPQLTNIIPQNHLIPNNKLANSLTKEIIDAGAVDLIVAGKGKNEITSRCILTYEGDNMTLTSRQPYTEYDRNVADAVTSLYVYGHESHIITPATVYREMVHATATETPSPQQIGAVTKSLEKSRFVRVQVDCTDELTKRKLSLNGAPVTGGKIDTYLLALRRIDVIAGGKIIPAYKVLETPILYDYARLTKQILTVPAALLDVRDESGAKIANTERRIAIKGYLVRRISVMKGKSGKSTSRNIKYETVYADVCEGSLSDKEKRLVREYIPQVLNYWVRQKWIKGYTEILQGKKKIGVEINI